MIALTAQYRVPGIHPFRYYATDGGLVSYGALLARADEVIE